MIEVEETQPDDLDYTERGSRLASSKPAWRTCLGCGVRFWSRGSGHRFCPACTGARGQGEPGAGSTCSPGDFLPPHVTLFSDLDLRGPVRGIKL